MKTIMTSGIKDGMFLLSTETAIVSNHLIKKETAIKMDSQAPIIESIFETIVEPIIYKC
ncbi:hypothetical protein [Flavobacterium aquicola]|uniref:Uncharacterized protein n=1 Tax=Flavobacterium aquicola TaxID=1682742 RepID=A0A3E0EP58_9FLAO|nr:hypothetical protein [Flavobacterium aquicola]REG99139.1 hypothetical protein C8P67_105311 [Flavobacterium aquicola]